MVEIIGTFYLFCVVTFLIGNGFWHHFKLLSLWLAPDCGLMATALCIGEIKWIWSAIFILEMTPIAFTIIFASLSYQEYETSERAKQMAEMISQESRYKESLDAQ